MTLLRKGDVGRRVLGGRLELYQDLGFETWESCFRKSDGGMEDESNEVIVEGGGASL